MRLVKRLDLFMKLHRVGNSAHIHGSRTVNTLDAIYHVKFMSVRSIFFLQTSRTAQLLDL